MIKLEIKPFGGGFSLLQITLDKPIQPSDLPSVEFPKAGGKGLIISGRAPIWLYCYVFHYYLHLFRVIAIYDPKLQGAIIVASHDPEYEVGNIIPLVEGV